MKEHIHFLNELPLLPDSELLEMAEETSTLAGRFKDRPGTRGRGQDVIARRLDAINRELKARGIGGAPWWSEHA